MGIWSDFSNWVDDLVFPKSDNKERRFAKTIALWQVVGSVVIAVGTAMIGFGIAISSLGINFSSQMYLLDIEEDAKAIAFFSQLTDETIETGGNFTDAGFIILIFGLILVVFKIIRER